MIQEKIRLGKTLILPPRWQRAIRVADGDELIVLYHEDGVLILKDLDNLHESLKVFLERLSFSADEYEARIAEMAAEYETLPLVQWAAEYNGPDKAMSPDLEALYLEAEQELHGSQLPPLSEGMTVHVGRRSLNAPLSP
jgi:hypothetical protein